jgi:hypothetical protein
MRIERPDVKEVLAMMGYLLSVLFIFAITLQ